MAAFVIGNGQRASAGAAAIMTARADAGNMLVLPRTGSGRNTTVRS
jgi:hypothetical protein